MNSEPLPMHPAFSSGQPSDIIGALRRQAWIVALCAVVGALLGVLYVKTEKVTYEARSTVLLLPLPGESSPGGGLQRTLDVETQATIARSTSLLERVGERLDMTAAEVRGTSRVEAQATGDVLYLWFTADDAASAAAGALVYTEEFLGQRKEDADAKARRQQDLVQRQIDTLRADITALSNQITAELDSTDPQATARLDVLEQQRTLAIENAASLADQRAAIDTDLDPGRTLVDPRQSVRRAGLDTKVLVVAGLFVGLLVGTLAALLRDRRDDRYGSATGLAARGVREIGRLRLPQGPREQRSQGIRRAYARLLIRLGRASAGRGAHRSVLVTAVESTTMPVTAAQSVIEALVDESGDNGVIARVLRSENIAAAAAGQGRSWEVFDDALRGVALDADVTFVSAAPLDRSVAALALSQRVDEVVLLVTTSTKVTDLQVALEDLAALDVHDVSVVVMRGRGPTAH